MEAQDNITCKVVLVGESGVGKTCIIQRYVKNDFSEGTESTIASTYSYKVLDIKKYNQRLSLDIWDTAGQELYRALAKNFYLNAAVGILVYDIRRRESFESIKNYWYDQMKESGEENIIIGLAGNKCDLFQEEAVSEEEAKKFADSIGAIFKLTSCKESVGIDELFEECAQKYVEINNMVKKDNKPKPGNLKLDNKNVPENNEGKKKKKFC